jgi:hypothetical protein
VIKPDETLYLLHEVAKLLPSRRRAVVRGLKVDDVHLKEEVGSRLIGDWLRKVGSTESFYSEQSTGFLDHLMLW